MLINQFILAFLLTFIISYSMAEPVLLDEKQISEVNETAFQELRNYDKTPNAILLPKKFDKLNELLTINKGKKAIYLDFWASWCGPCKISIPWLNRMQKEYGDQGFMVIGVNLDKDQAKLKRFLIQIPVDFELIKDPEGLIASNYVLEGMPSSFLIDKEGKTRFKHIGFRTNEIEKYEKEIQQLIK